MKTIALLMIAGILGCGSVDEVAALPPEGGQAGADIGGQSGAGGAGGQAGAEIDAGSPDNTGAGGAAQAGAGGTESERGGTSGGRGGTGGAGNTVGSGGAGGTASTGTGNTAGTDAGPPPVPCPGAWLTRCSGLCVDTSSSSTDCGACGVRCVGTCSSGACR